MREEVSITLEHKFQAFICNRCKKRWDPRTDGYVCPDGWAELVVISHNEDNKRIADFCAECLGAVVDGWV